MTSVQERMDETVHPFATGFNPGMCASRQDMMKMIGEWLCLARFTKAVMPYTT